jgi:hypothetical protein
MAAIDATDQDIYEAGIEEEAPASPEPAPAPPAAPGETAPPAAQGETAPADPGLIDATPAPQHMVPLRELLDTRERAQRAEQERQELARQLEHLRRQETQAREAEARRPVQAPDMFMDPDGYSSFVQQQIAARVAEVTQNLDLRETQRAFRRAEAQHGAEWPKAWQAFNAAASNSPPLQQAFLQVDPADRGEEIVKWWQQQEVAREVGGDPKAYQEKLKQQLLADPEFIAQAVAAAQAQAGGSQSRNVTRLPPSLNHRTGAGARTRAGAVDYGTDQDIWDAGNARSG